MADDAIFAIALSNVPGVGPATYRALCERFGDARSVFAAGRNALESFRGLRPETAAALADGERIVRAARSTAARLAEQGYDIITIGSRGYPNRLLDLRDPPPVLYSLGPLPGPRTRAFSVAGSKTPSARGAGIAHTAGRELAQAGWTLVSGYAPGIDTAAHVGTLEAGGRTVLVLPMGVFTFTLRPEFESFRSQLGRKITLVSECQPDEPWSSRAAVRRDRLITALGWALLAVEARPAGGTMITFRHALRLGRPAYVVKYRRAPDGASGNRLAIRAGGLPVESVGVFKRIIRAAELPKVALAARQGELF